MSIVPFIPVIVLFILFFMRVPVAFSMLVSSLVYFLFINTTMPIEISVQRVVSSMESFPYLAIPFFTCAGVVFNYSGITKKLIGLAEVLVGHFVGGLGHANVLLAALMGGLSGSANADAAMQTKIVVPQMVKRGYGKGFSVVVTAAASCITPIIPPGIILILYAVAADVSIAKMFFAGYLPGLLICVALMIVVSIIAKKRKYPPSREKRASLAEVFSQLKESVWALFLPFGILMGLRYGVFTPTEAGAVSVVYSLLIGIFVYKELKAKDFKAILVESIEGTAGVLFIIASANVFGAYLTWERIPMNLSETLVSSIQDPTMMLIVINLLLLVLGCFFEGGAAMILLAPILVPAVSGVGIDLIHFGILMSINLTIAGFTPPFGTMMFITTSIAGVPLSEYMRECWPFLIALVAVLIVLIFVPQIILWVPNLMLG